MTAGANSLHTMVREGSLPQLTPQQRKELTGRRRRQTGVDGHLSRSLYFDRGNRVRDLGVAVSFMANRVAAAAAEYERDQGRAMVTGPGLGLNDAVWAWHQRARYRREAALDRLLAALMRLAENAEVGGPGVGSQPGQNGGSS